MSLVRGLTTTGRTKRKVKFASAEAKRNHEQLQRDWESLKSKWGVTDKSKQSSTVVELPTVAKSSIRTTERPTSLNSWTVKNHTTVYGHKTRWHWNHAQE